MSTEAVQRKVTGPVEQRSLTGSAAADVALAFASGAGAAVGKVVIDQIAQHVTKPKDEKPKIVLPDDKES